MIFDEYFQLEKNIIFVEHLVPYFRYDIFVLDRHYSDRPLGLIENSKLSHGGLSERRD